MKRPHAALRNEKSIKLLNRLRNPCKQVIATRALYTLFVTLQCFVFVRKENAATEDRFGVIETWKKNKKPFDYLFFTFKCKTTPPFPKAGAHSPCSCCLFPRTEIIKLTSFWLPAWIIVFLCISRLTQEIKYLNCIFFFGVWQSWNMLYSFYLSH